MGGGVQPANRGKIGMFCEVSPIWPFLAALAAKQDPLAARLALIGRHLIEVFPALALPSLEPAFSAGLEHRSTIQRTDCALGRTTGRQFARLLRPAFSAGDYRTRHSGAKLLEPCLDRGRLTKTGLMLSCA